jgi:hypothetical protein
MYGADSKKPWYSSTVLAPATCISLLQEIAFFDQRLRAVMVAMHRNEWPAWINIGRERSPP